MLASKKMLLTTNLWEGVTNLIKQTDVWVLLCFCFINFQESMKLYCLRWKSWTPVKCLYCVFVLVSMLLSVLKYCLEIWDPRIVPNIILFETSVQYPNAQTQHCPLKSTGVQNSLHLNEPDSFMKTRQQMELVTRPKCHG